MALIWMEGFDNYNKTAGGLDFTQSAAGGVTWLVPGITSWDFNNSAPAPRTGYGRYLAINGGPPLVMQMPVAKASGILGLAYQRHQFGLGPDFYFCNAGTTLFRVEASDGINLNIRNSGGTVISTATVSSLPWGAEWIYWEIAFTVGASTGSIEVRCNSMPVLVASGLNLGTTSVDQIHFAGQMNCDDAYLCDLTVGPGIYPMNYFLGDVLVRQMLVDANAGVQWTPLAGANWQAIKELISDDATTYNSSSTAGQADKFNLSPLVQRNQVILATAVRGVYQNATAGAASVLQTIDVGGTSFNGATVAHSTDWQQQTDMYPVNPLTGYAWQPSDLTPGSTKIGYNKTTGTVATRATQLFLMALVPNWSLGVPSIFPVLSGLSYPVLKRPKWSTLVDSHSSGREARLGLWTFPMWEFELTFDWLPDYVATPDIRRMMGFYNNNRGALTPFLFKDPSDYTVTGQAMGTGDGTTADFQIVRTYGGSSSTEQSTEAVGWVNTSATLNVYLNGVLKTITTDYTITQNRLVDNYVHFVTPPGAGVAVTMDFSFYFACRFGEDMVEFQEIADAIWEQGKLVLKSIRAE